jgi:ribosome-binding factor A
MNHSANVSAIKRAQKESLLFQQISQMFHTMVVDDNRLDGVFVNRVELSTDKSSVMVYFYTADGLEKFEEILQVLKLYKPSMRKGLADQIKARYVPDLRFSYDTKFEKQQRLEEVMKKAADQISEHQSVLEDDDDADDNSGAA